MTTTTTADGVIPGRAPKALPSPLSRHPERALDIDPTCPTRPLARRNLEAAGGGHSSDNPPCERFLRASERGMREGAVMIRSTMLSAKYNTPALDRRSYWRTKALLSTVCQREI